MPHDLLNNEAIIKVSPYVDGQQVDLDIVANWKTPNRPVVPAPVVNLGRVRFGDKDTSSPSPEAPRGYIVNGVNNKTITLVRGKKYTFDLDIPGHPMHIQTSAAGGYDPQRSYVLHSSMNGKFIGDYTFTVASDTPDTLWYQCRFHNAMQGRILIVNPE